MSSASHPATPFALRADEVLQPGCSLRMALLGAIDAMHVTAGDGSWTGLRCIARLIHARESRPADARGRVFDSGAARQKCRLQTTAEFVQTSQGR
jgi:hypothetical protein